MEIILLKVESAGMHEMERKISHRLLVLFHILFRLCVQDR